VRRFESPPRRKKIRLLSLFRDGINKLVVFLLLFLFSMESFFLISTRDGVDLDMDLTWILVDVKELPSYSGWHRLLLQKRCLTFFSEGMKPTCPL